MLAKNRPDLVAGPLLIALAAFAAYYLLRLPFGTAARPGAGFVPLGTASLLALLGMAVMLRGVFGTPDSIEPGRLRPLLAVLGAIAGFAALIEPAGLPIAIFAAIVVGSLAQPGRLDRRTVIFAIGLAGLCTATFKYGLGLPFKLVP